MSRTKKTTVPNYCVVEKCDISSTTYLDCLGRCGKKIHAICGGMSRSCIPDAGYSPYFKFVCHSCDERLSDNIAQNKEFNALLSSHGESVGKLVNQVKQIQLRMDNSEEVIDDIDKSLHSIDGQGLASRLELIDKHLASLANRSTCECSELVISITKLIEQLEKNLKQSFETSVKSIVHSLHTSLHASFLSSVTEVVDSVGNNVSILIDDKIGELVALTPCNSSTVAVQVNTTDYVNEFNSPPPSIDHTNLQQSNSIVDVASGAPLLSELSLSEPDFSQPGMRYPEYNDTTADLLVVNNMARLCGDFGWDGGLIYTDYVCSDFSYFLDNRTTNKPAQNKALKWSKPVVSAVHYFPVFPNRQTKTSKPPNQYSKNRQSSSRHRLSWTQSSYVKVHNRHPPHHPTLFKQGMTSSYQPIRWQHEEDTHVKFNRMLEQQLKLRTHSY